MNNDLDKFLKVPTKSERAKSVLNMSLIWIVKNRKKSIALFLMVFSATGIVIEPEVLNKALDILTIWYLGA